MRPPMVNVDVTSPRAKAPMGIHGGRPAVGFRVVDREGGEEGMVVWQLRASWGALSSAMWYPNCKGPRVLVRMAKVL